MEASQFRFTTLNQIHFSDDRLSSKSLGSFHFFTNLPPELKLKYGSCRSLAGGGSLPYASIKKSEIGQHLHMPTVHQ